MEQIVLMAGIILLAFSVFAWVSAMRAERRWTRMKDKALKALEEAVVFHSEAMERWKAAQALAHSLETEDG